MPMRNISVQRTSPSGEQSLTEANYCCNRYARREGKLRRTRPGFRLIAALVAKA